MQPFHVKQIWMKKNNGPIGNPVPLKKEEELSEEKPIKITPLPNWEDLLPEGLDVLRHISVEKSKTNLPNPYRYNISRSSPKPPLGPSPLRNGSTDEVKEKITELEKISKACVETVGEGVDAYWLMSKDLDHKVNDIDSRMTTLTNIVIEMAAEKKEILNIVQQQQATIIELSARFACVAHACTWKGKEEEEEAEAKTPCKEN